MSAQQNVIVKSLSEQFFKGNNLYRLYKPVFRLLLAVWSLKHPPTFKFHYNDIIAAVEKATLELEEFCWVPKIGDILQFGIRVRGFFSPGHIRKFVFTKRK